MTLKNKFVKALEILLSDESTQSLAGKKEQNYEEFLAQFTDNSEFQKIRELQSMVYGLSSKVTVLADKVTVLADKVNELNDQIVHLTTLNEELLYVIDQGIGQQEDNETSVSVHFKAKKYELN